MRASAGRTALAMVAVVAMACGGGGGQKESEKPAAEGKPAYGDMLVVGMQADADVLFPPTSTSASSGDIIGNIFWYLMRSEPDFFHFKPGLADSFRFTPDSLAVDFFINPGARWHDGVPVTADDVVFAFGVCKSPVINFSSVSWLDHITKVEALDPHTVRFHFDQRYMYQVMDATVCYPLPKHILGDMSYQEMLNADYTRAPVGDGPFRFVSWTPGEEITIEAVPDFFRGRPYLNRISYRVIPEPTSIATQLSNGAVDTWPRAVLSFYPQLSKDPNLEIHSIPGRSYTYIAYNTKDPILSDQRVRQALTYGLDRQQIVDALLYGQGQIATQPMITTIWAHDSTIKPYPYDPEKAKALLEEAGWTDTNGDGIREKDGKPLRFAIKTNANNTMRVDIATVAQEQWKRIGVDLQLRTLEFNTFIGQLMDHDFQAALGGWVVGIKAELEPTFGLGERFNFPQVENATLDSLIQTAETTRDRAAAMKLWSRAQRIIVDQAYYTFLFQQNDLLPVNKRFQGVVPTTYSWDDSLRTWYVPEGMQKYQAPVGASPFAKAAPDSAAAPAR